MTRKQWILITVALALIHGILANLLMPISSDIIFSRFDGNAYNSPWDPLLVGLYLVLHFPQLLVKYTFSPIRYLPPVISSYLLWIGNSLVWGLMGAWLISKLPFMKEQNTSA